MKAANLALVALAGFGLVSSQIAFADTMPGAALPTLRNPHPAKIARLTEKRSADLAHSESGIVAGFPFFALLIGAAAVSSITYAIVEVNKTTPVSTGG